MDINIEPLQTTPLPTAANSQPRRVEPTYQTQYALTRDDPRDTIRFSDQLIRSNLGEPDTTLPRQSPHAQTAPQPEAPQPIPLKPSQDTPKLGDVSPVEQKQTTLQYHKTLRLERTLNLGSIVDLIV